MSENHRHVMGSEMEWAVVNDQGITPGPLPVHSEAYLPDNIVSLSTFLSNGGRFYGDVGNHIEYATPENITLDDVVLSELAGERLVVESLRRFVAANPISMPTASLLKRVVDDNNETWGYHVNVSEERDFLTTLDGAKPGYENVLRTKLQPLFFHYATSLFMLGGGAVQKPIGPSGYRYSFGQKIIDLEGDVAGGTTSHKPFISSRDEPHMNSYKYARIHIVGTDPHISPWATKMMFGTTTLMLEGIKQGRIRDLKFHDGIPAPGVRIARKARFDLEGVNKYIFKTADGVKKYTDADLQEIFIEDLEKVSGKTADNEWTLAEWKTAIEDRRQDVMRLRDRSDAIAKLSLIQRQNRSNDRPEDTIDENAMRLDKRYTSIARTTAETAAEDDVDELMRRQIPGYLRRTLFSRHMPSSETIENRMYNPPTNTRASVRAKVITDPLYKQGLSGPRLQGLQWAQYTVTDGMTSKKTEMDPWKGIDNE